MAQSTLARTDASCDTSVSADSRAQDPGSGIDLVVVWAAASAAVVLLGGTTPLAIGALVAGAMAALAVTGAPLATRVLTIAALAPALFAAPSGALVVAGGAAVSLATGGRRRPRGDRVPSAAQRHLLRCRRLETPAAVVVVRGVRDRASATRLTEAFRLTDSLELDGSGSGYEIRGVLDVENLDRRGLESRLSDVVPGLSFGWAGFPDDGVTLDVLVEGARAHAVSRSSVRPSRLGGLRWTPERTGLAAGALAEATEQQSGVQA